MRPHRPEPWVLIPALFALLVMSSGCQPGEDASDKARKPHQRKASAHLVEVTPVIREPVGLISTLTGSLKARKSVRIHSQEEGQILSMPYFEGDKVELGDILITLDDTLLQREKDKAQAEYRRASADLARQRELAKSNLASAQDLAEAEKALAVAKAEGALLETRLSFTRISAPFSGTVTARLAEPGDVISKHTHVMSIADQGSLITELSASELLLPWIEAGQAVEVRIDALGADAFPGRVLRIHPTISPETRRGIVEVALEPVPPRARSGQFCRVTLSTRRAERLLIPFSALRRDRDGLYVYRITDNQARRVEIDTGLKFKARIEVLTGLAEGDQVVLRGFMGLGDGKAVEVVPPADQSNSATAQGV